ncbi:hypothetical protein HBH73_138910 [Parastagonospora nodorum]|nr:hypothetical protein HBH84_161860 [Parastagonospora nodorum]KAH4946454.1 hypothetical protein HBH73_138910 [Parastagonospora nodorum]
MAFFPLCKPFEIPGTGQYIQTMPTNPHAKVLLSGDMTVNPGIWVRQSILSGSKAHGKYANVALEKWSFQEMVDVWSEVTGKSPEELGIDRNEVVGFRGTIEGFKKMGFWA